MKNIILLSVLAVFLTSCGSSVQEIQVTTVEVSKTPLNLPNPDPLKLQDVEWIIITKDNANEIFERIKSAGGEYALFAVEDTGYEKLQKGIFSNYKLGFMHGKLLKEEKNDLIDIETKYYELEKQTNQDLNIATENLKIEQEKLKETSQKLAINSGSKENLS